MRHGSGVSRRGASLKEPRTGKSFRAAGVRIVRQESAAPSMVPRLLGARAQAVRKIRSDADAWAVRLAALATLSQYDGLAFVVGEPLHLSHAYNVAGDPLADPAIRAAVDDIGRNSATARIPAAARRPHRRPRRGASSARPARSPPDLLLCRRLVSRGRVL